MGGTKKAAREWRPRLVAIVVMIAFGILNPAQAQTGEPGAIRSLSLLEALQITIEQSVPIALKREDVNAAIGARQQASGLFDLNFHSYVSHSRTQTALTDAQQGVRAGFPLETALSNLTSYELGATRLFRNGIQLRQAFTIQRSVHTVDDRLGLNLSHTGLEVTLPLLKGRGTTATAADEIAADLQLAARQLQFRQGVSERLANTAVRYWEYVAALRSLRVAEETEQRGERLVENVKALIEADKLPRSSVHQVSANYADRSAGRAAAKQRVVEAREALAQAMGVASYVIATDLAPLNELPAIVELRPVPDRVGSYTQEALKRRADLFAAEKAASAFRVLYAGSKNSMMPEVNLTLSTGYSGQRVGTAGNDFFRSVGGNARGPDVSAGISYQFAPRNDAATGRMRQAVAAVRSAELATRQVELEVRSSVAAALSATLNAAEQWRSASQSVLSFQAALNGERERFRLGTGSITDVLLIEDRLTTAANTEIIARLAYANALARLRAATGSIVPVDSDAYTLDPDIFYGFPFEGSVRP